MKKEGFSEIETAGSVAEGLRAFEQFSLTEKAMIYVKKFRKTSHIPVLFLSAKSDEVDKILGFAIGGDDYITRPFSPKEVAFRV